MGCGSSTDKGRVSVCLFVRSFVGLLSTYACICMGWQQKNLSSKPRQQLPVYDFAVREENSLLKIKLYM